MVLKAAKQGHVLSQFAMGRLYTVGKGVKADGKEANNWFQKAAEQHHYKAQLALGKNYLDGNGIKQDLVLAKNGYNNLQSKDIQKHNMH